MNSSISIDSGIMTRSFNWYPYMNKRSPKQWSLEKLHNLFIYFTKRREISLNNLANYQDRIWGELDKINIGGKDGIILFHTHKNWEDEVFSKFISSSKYGGYSESSLDNLSKMKEREEVIYSMIDYEKKLSYGNEYDRISSLCRMSSIGVIFRSMQMIVDEHLRDHYKDINEYLIPKTMIISISGSKYYAHYDMNKYKFELDSRTKVEHPIILSE